MFLISDSLKGIVDENDILKSDQDSDKNHMVLFVINDDIKFNVICFKKSKYDNDVITVTLFLNLKFLEDFVFNKLKALKIKFNNDNIEINEKYEVVKFSFDRNIKLYKTVVKCRIVNKEK